VYIHIILLLIFFTQLQPSPKIHGAKLVYATLTYNGKQMIGAKVSATVTSFIGISSSRYIIALTDNGQYPDSFANDGIYSTLILPLGNGIYEVKLSVKGGKKKRQDYRRWRFNRVYR